MDLRWLLEREEETGDVGGEEEVSDDKEDTPFRRPFSINVKEESTAGEGDERD